MMPMYPFRTSGKMMTDLAPSSVLRNPRQYGPATTVPIVHERPGLADLIRQAAVGGERGRGATSLSTVLTSIMLLGRASRDT